MIRIIKAVLKFLYWLIKIVLWLWRRLRPKSTSRVGHAELKSSRDNHLSFHEGLLEAFSSGKNVLTSPFSPDVSVSHNYVSAARMQSALNEEISATTGRMCIDSSLLYPYPEHLSLVGQVLEWGSP